MPVFRAANILTVLGVLVIAAICARDFVELRLMPAQGAPTVYADVEKKASGARAPVPWPVEVYKQIAGKGAFGKGEFRPQALDANGRASGAGGFVPPLELLGTATGAGGFAVFVDRGSGKQGLFGKGENVFGYGVLEGMDRERAFISSGEKEFVFTVPRLDKRGVSVGLLRQSGQGGPQGEIAGTRTIDARAFRSGLERPEKMLSDAVFSLYSASGSYGFRISEIREGSVFSLLGLIDGDVVIRVNGYPVDSPEKAAQVFAGLKGETAISMEIIRGGDQMALKYSIR